MELTKTCRKCGITKDVSEFGKEHRVHDGLTSRCRTCLREDSRISQQKHKDESRIRLQDWRKSNPEKVREQKRRHRLAHPDTELESFRRWVQENRDHRDEYRSQYRANHSAELAEQSKLYRKAHPERKRLSENTRRARKASNGGVLKLSEWTEIKEFYGFRCLKCGRKEPEIQLTIDHVIPLALGGENKVDNVQPLCRSCNSSKRTRPFDYRGKDNGTIC